MKILNTVYLVLGLAIIFIGFIAVANGIYFGAINFLTGGYFVVDAITNFYVL